MDAYIFSTQATQAAVSELADGVGSTGPARVVQPLIGTHALYVAVEGEDSEDLATRVAAVVATDGLSGITTYAASATDSEFPFPTHGVVDNFVGFCLLATSPGLSLVVYEAARQVSGVIGAAVVTGTASVLVEVTAGNVNALASILNAVSGLTGVVSAHTSSGATSLGTGYPT